MFRSDTQVRHERRYAGKSTYKFLMGNPIPWSLVIRGRGFLMSKRSSFPLLVPVASRRPSWLKFKADISPSLSPMDRMATFPLVRGSKNSTVPIEVPNAQSPCVFSATAATFTEPTWILPCRPAPASSLPTSTWNGLRNFPTFWGFG
jgi:hypothetical protein